MVVTRRSAESKGAGSTLVTREAIEKDTISTLAIKFWAPSTAGSHNEFNDKLVDDIYRTEMVNTHFNPRKIVMLEFSQYLECYLWPNYNSSRSKAYHMSIVIMVNEKFRERTDAWLPFSQSPERFPEFFNNILKLSLDHGSSSSMAEHCSVLTFLVNAFNSVETGIVHDQTRLLTSMEIWENLLESQREDMFKKHKKLRKLWGELVKRFTKLDSGDGGRGKFQRTFLYNLIERFKATLSQVEDESKDVDVDAIRYCERFIELLIDLESLLPTRRFVNALIHSTHVLTQCLMSNLIKSEAGSLFFQLVQQLNFFARFEIDEFSGRQLSHKEVSELHYESVIKLQKAAFRYFRDTMKNFYVLNVSNVDTRKALYQQFTRMKHEDVYRFAEYLHLVDKMPSNEEDAKKQLERFTQPFLVEAITLTCERRPNQLTQLNEKPLFPTEEVIWDENVVPYEHYSGDGVLALNKLNLQFLTLHDYLLRNFNLFQLESTYEIRQDLEDVLFRMKPFMHETRGETVFAGWARMALTVENFNITEVAKPLVGEKSPACVRGILQVNIGRRFDIRQEWEGNIWFF